VRVMHLSHVLLQLGIMAGQEVNLRVDYDDWTIRRACELHSCESARTGPILLAGPPTQEVKLVGQFKTKHLKFIEIFLRSSHRTQDAGVFRPPSVLAIGVTGQLLRLNACDPLSACRQAPFFPSSSRTVP
jgi:hypothetical protein